MICFVLSMIMAGAMGMHPVETGSAADASVMVYYFHRTIRCVGCLEIEALANSVVETDFVDEMACGKIEWVTLNLDDEGVEPLGNKYGVTANGLVFVKMVGGEEQGFKRLDGAWDYVGQGDAMEEFIRNELRDFITH